MLDLETLGTRPDAAIIQIGAVFFEPKSGGKILNGDKAFNQHVLYQDGIGTVDHGTLAFWLKEKSAARMGEALSNDAEFLPKVMQSFIAWPKTAMLMDWAEVGRIWASPSDFDLPILKSAMVRCGLGDMPWDRRSTRDARTLFDIVGGRPEIDWTGMVAHDALDDAVGQAMQVQQALALIERKS